MYVSGELRSQRDVVEFIGCHPSTVRNRSQKEGWGKERQKLVQKLSEQGESVAGLLRVQSTEQEASSLASSRLAIASQTLALSSALIQQSQLLSVSLETALAQPPDRLQPDHLRSLTQTQGLLLDQLLRLSGLAGSSTTPPKPAPAPAPAARPGRDAPWADPV